MPNSSPRTAGEPSREDHRPKGAAVQEPVCISVGRSRASLLGTGTVRARLLHVAVVPLFVAAAAYGLEGEASLLLVRQGGAVALLLAATYGAGVALTLRLERFPFIGALEAALLSLGLTLVPAGLLLAGMAAPLSSVGLLATGGSIGWYLASHFFHRGRPARLLVLPGGRMNRLLALPGVSVVETGADPPGELDGVVADLRGASPDPQESLANDDPTGRSLYSAGDVYRRLTARVPVGPSPQAGGGGPPLSYSPSAKRALDLLLAVASLPITGPLMAGAALAIWVESRGPLLFWQERVGRGGETFQMAKFRSMHVGHEGEHRAVFAEEDDDRVTTVGQVLRTLRIDELPQIWNVLKGEMSLIGPRPEQVGLANHFGDALRLYQRRHRVRPGITGWAQVLQGYAADVDETRRKLEYDLYYVRHRSLFLDLLVVYLTVKTLLTGFGAR